MRNESKVEGRRRWKNPRQAKTGAADHLQNFYQKHYNYQSKMKEVEFQDFVEYIRVVHNSSVLIPLHFWSAVFTFNSPPNYAC